MAFGQKKGDEPKAMGAGSSPFGSAVGAKTSAPVWSWKWEDPIRSIVRHMLHRKLRARFKQTLKITFKLLKTRTLNLKCIIPHKFRGTSKCMTKARILCSAMIKKQQCHPRRSGITTLRTVPSDDVSTTEISPPWDFTSSAAMASPSPVPPWRAEV